MLARGVWSRCLRVCLCVCFLAGTLTPMAAATGLTGARQYQPVVVQGKAVSALTGAPVDQLALFVYASASQDWQRVPLQIDERVLAPDPWDPGSQRLLYFAEDDGLLDADDELVFMCKDLGDRAGPNVWLDVPETCTHPRVEIKVVDPLSGRAAWGYLYRASVFRNGNPEPYHFSYDAGQDRVSTASYEVRLGRETGLVEDMAVLPPWGSGVDFFDTQKIRMVGLLTVFSLSLPFGRDWNPQAANERDNLFIYQDSTRTTRRPVVRLVRRALQAIKFGVYVFDDARFPVVTKFYPYSVTLAGGADLSNLGESVDVELDLLRQSWDFNAAATGMRWMNRYNDGVVIDGEPDTVNRKVDLPIREWFAATGDQGTLFTYVSFADTLGQRQVLYYLDNKNGGQADGTQVDGGDTGEDSVSYGDIGILATGKSERPNLRLDFQAYFLPGNIDRTEVEDLVQAVEHPVTVETHAQTYGQTRVAEPAPNLLAAFSLQPAYPNPFNAATQIRFSLPREARLRATIVDQLGRTRRVLVDAKLSRGIHRLTWDGRDDAGRDLPSGTYLLRVWADGQVISRKLTLLR